MELLLNRVKAFADHTLGELFVDGAMFCYVCEDVVRPAGQKVYGQTAIPAGRYEVRITFSNRFQCLMPLLLNVPNFEGIRIHPGNKAVDTDGCLLPGMQVTNDGVGESRAAYRPLYNLIQNELARGKPVWITVQ